MVHQHSPRTNPIPLGQVGGVDMVEKPVVIRLVDWWEDDLRLVDAVISLATKNFPVWDLLWYCKTRIVYSVGTLWLFFRVLPFLFPFVAFLIVVASAEIEMMWLDLSQWTRWWKVLVMECCGVDCIGLSEYGDIAKITPKKLVHRDYIGSDGESLLPNGEIPGTLLISTLCQGWSNSRRKEDMRTDIVEYKLVRTVTNAMLEWLEWIGYSVKLIGTAVVVASFDCLLAPMFVGRNWHHGWMVLQRSLAKRYRVRVVRHLVHDEICECLTKAVDQLQDPFFVCVELHTCLRNFPMTLGSPQRWCVWKKFANTRNS